MGLALCKCCCCFCCCDSADKRSFPVILVGLSDSGKTEVGHQLASISREDVKPTNGAKQYQVKVMDEVMAITEIGGSEDLQKLWPYYFPWNMAVIFCYDLSAPREKLRQSFDLLQQTMAHPCVRGKAILLIGTKADLANPGVQLYDIENTFNLERMANIYSCRLRTCHFGRYANQQKSGNNQSTESLKNGIDWLMGLLVMNHQVLRSRIKYDVGETRSSQTRPSVRSARVRRATNEIWNKLSRSQRRVRPNTAPGILMRGEHDEHINS